VAVSEEHAASSGHGVPQLEERLAGARRSATARSRRRTRSSPIAYIEIEEQNNNLRTVRRSSYQLHSTLDYKEVVGSSRRS
jgi:hypothetical protein